MPPPPRPKTQRRNLRDGGRKSAEHIVANQMTDENSRGGRAHRAKHARPSDTETESELESKRPLIHKARRSEVNPNAKIETPRGSTDRPSLGASVFSDDNPFQSGSSPLVPSEHRRRSTGADNKRRKSSSRRQKAESISQADKSRIKQEDGVVVPSAKRFEIPVTALRNSVVKDESDDGVEIGEEFTPEEQLDLAKERDRNREKDILPSRKKKRSGKTNSIPRSAPWVVLMTLLAGYGFWWRLEKLDAGYCGIGRPSSSLSNIDIPEWVTFLRPECEPCPQHAICFERLETKCDTDFVLEPHPLSLGGLVPLPPTCEPDGDKVRRIKVVADRAIEEMRERKAGWECGTLVDDKGKSISKVEIDEESLKKSVGKKRRRGMTEAEFEDLWKGALGEIIGREEVIHSTDEYYPLTFIHR